MNLCWSITLFAALTLSGCIIPILPGSNPFEERVDFIRVGQTNRAEVIAKLSAPPIARRHERLFGYIAYERGYGVLVIIGAGGAPPLVMGRIGLIPRFVGIEFDEQNIVSHYDQAAVKSHVDSTDRVQEPWRACLPTGVCIDFHKGAIVSAQEDAQAKRFQNVQDRCAIYLVRADIAPEGELPGPRLFPVYLDGVHAGESGPGTYFYWNISPGQHTIEAKPLDDAIRSTVFLHDSTNKGQGGSVQFACSPAENVFVLQNSLGRLEIVPEQEGKEAVQQAEKLLDNF